MTAKRSGTEAFTFLDPVTGREVRQLTQSSERSVHGYYDLPPWSPVDGRIAFTSLAPGASEGDVYMMDRDGANITYLAHSRDVSSNDGAMAQWSHDGRRVYFKDEEDGAPRLAWVDVVTGEQGAYPGSLRMICQTAHRNVYHTECHDLPDHVVRDGKEEHGVFLMDLETGSSRRLVTVDDCLALHPRRDEVQNWHLYIKHTKWSPDGQRVMFVFTNANRYETKYGESPWVKDIYVVNADGSGLARVGEFGGHPLWHPAGREILAVTPYPGRRGRSLVMHDVRTGALRLAASCIAGFGHPSFAPDGRRIVVDHVLPGEGSGSLNLVDTATDTVEHLVQTAVRDHTHVGTHLHPVWSQDGREVLYASDASGIAQLCVIDV